jgi:hypothetical protein
MTLKKTKLEIAKKKKNENEESDESEGFVENEEQPSDLTTQGNYLKHSNESVAIMGIIVEITEVFFFF